MTRLFDLPHGKMHELTKQLQSAGLTAEMAEALLKDRTQLRRWVKRLNDPGENGLQLNADRIRIDEAITDHSIVNQLRRIPLTYLDELADCCYAELGDIRTFGPTRLKTIEDTLATHGLRLSIHPRPMVNECVVVGSGSRAIHRDHLDAARVEDVACLYRFDYAEPGHDWLPAMDMTVAEARLMSREQMEATYSIGGIRKVYGLLRAYPER